MVAVLKKNRENICHEQYMSRFGLYGLLKYTMIVTNPNFIVEKAEMHSPINRNVIKTLFSRPFSFQYSVFQVKYSVSRLLLWLVCMQFPIQDQYIQNISLGRHRI